MDNNRFDNAPPVPAMFSDSELPHSLDAEQAVLGAALLEHEILDEVMMRLSPEHFHIKHHREIFSAMKRLSDAGTRVDIITVLSEVVNMGVFDEEHARRYLVALGEMVPSLDGAVVYCEIIRRKYELRALILAARQIIADASDESNDPENVLDRAEQRIFEIANERGSQEMLPFTPVMMKAVDKLELMSQPDRRDEFVGIPTGISLLDHTISGLCKSDLIILAARPGVGKTSFALNIARNVAVNKKRPVAFFSLEMTCEQLVLRILSTESGVENTHMRDGRLDLDEWTALVDAGSRLHGAPIFLDDHSDITVTEIKAKLRRMNEQLKEQMGGLGLVIIDYLQIMRGRGSASRENDVADISRNLKIMAKELNVPVLCLSQLNRMVEGRKDRKPQLSDIRESGAIEQDADIVLMLYREVPDGEDKDYSQAMTKAVCSVAKNRHGECMDIELNWDGSTTRFSAVENFRNGPN